MVRLVGELSKAVTAVATVEERGIPREASSVAEGFAVKRAAFGGAREALSAVGKQIAAEGTATVLGAMLVTARPDESVSRGYLRTRISPEERKEFDFGDLPDRLIGNIKLGISEITPDTFDPTTALRLAGRTAQITAGRPPIDAYELRVKLGDYYSDAPLVGKIRPTEAAVYSGIITLAHFQTQQFFLATGPEAEITGGAEALNG